MDTDILQERIALYQSGDRSIEPWATITIRDYLLWVYNGKTPGNYKLVNNDNWKRRQGLNVMEQSFNTITKIRSGVTSDEKDTLKQKHLTGVTFGHCQPLGESTGVVIPRQVAGKNHGGTRFFAFDIDGLESVEQAVAERNRLYKAIPSALAVARSASGKGLWLVIAISRQTINKDDYKQIWWMLAAELQEVYGVKIGVSGGTDRAPSNLVSLRFYSYDPDIKVHKKEELVLFDVPDPDDVPTVEDSKIRAGLIKGKVAKPQRSPRDQQTLPTKTLENGKPSEPVKTVTPQVPSYSQRIEWVAQATGGQGDSHHGRALKAIWLDVMGGHVPDDDRIDGYTEAIGRDDRAEVIRMVDGAVEKLGNNRQEQARGVSETPSTLFPDPLTMPITECELDLGVNADKVLPIDKVLFVPEQRIWRIWEGNCWRDGTLELTSWMGAVGKETYGVWKQQKNGGKQFKPQRSTGGRISTARNAIQFLRSSVRERSTVLWDDNRRVLGLPNGECLEITSEGATVRKQLPTDYITQTLPFAPADDWRSSEFETFLNRVVPDEETRNYLQRHLGYGLICDGTEPYFLWFRGAGRSGKSTLVRFLQSCIPQHFTTVQRDTLLLKMSSRHLTSEAKLANKRIVYWAEARGDGNVDAEKIKGYTGGDEQTSHFMRQDMFDWTPRFLLVIVSNNNLQLSAPDEAFYERVRLVDCWKTIPAKERSVSVFRDARSGSPQCLRWLADGARDYVRAIEAGNGSGLLPETQKMKDDRYDWQFNSDMVSKFVHLRCKIIDNPTTTADVLSVKSLYPKFMEFMNEQRIIGETDRETESITVFNFQMKGIPGIIHKQWRFVNSDLRLRGFNVRYAPPKDGDHLF